MVRPILFIFIGVLVFSGEFSTQAAIAFLGSLAYVLSSSRTVLSLFTNLLRYQPQVKQYTDLLDSYEENNSEKENNYIVNETTPSSTNEKKKLLAMVLLNKPLTTLTAGHFMPQLISWSQENGHYINDEIYFVGAQFRFDHSKTVAEHLCGTSNFDSQILSKAKSIADYLDATDSFVNLTDSWDTHLSEKIWNELSPAARVCLRVIPLALKNPSSTLFIDIAIIKSINPSYLNKLIDSLIHCNLFVTTTSDFFDFPIIETYISINEKGIINSSKNYDWFIEELRKNKLRLDVLENEIDAATMTAL